MNLILFGSYFIPFFFYINVILNVKFVKGGTNDGQMIFHTPDGTLSVQGGADDSVKLTIIGGDNEDTPVEQSVDHVLIKTSKSGGTNIFKITSDGETIINAKGSANNIINAEFGGTYKFKVESDGDVHAVGTFQPTGDTAAEDNAAMGYTAVAGLVLTGQGTTSDVTIRNDDGGSVITIPTGTTTTKLHGDLLVEGGDIQCSTVGNAQNVFATTTGLTTLGGGAVNIGASGSATTIDGSLHVAQAVTFASTLIGDEDITTKKTFNAQGDTAAEDNAAMGYTAAAGLVLTGQGTTSDVTIRNDDGDSVITIPTGTTTTKLHGDLNGNVMTYGGVITITNTGTTGGSTHVTIDGVNFDNGKLTTADAIESGALATNSVTSDAIAADAVGSSEIAANAVGSSEIAANAVGSSEIADGAVTATQIAANTITASQIAANTITASQIASNTITATQIAANAVDTSELNSGAVTTAKRHYTTTTGNGHSCGSCSSNDCNADGELGAFCLAYDNANTCYYRFCVCLRSSNSGYGWAEMASRSWGC